jgi:hypothetical protein
VFRIKKGWTILLAAVLVVTLFAGCNKNEASSPDLLTVRQRATGNTLSIGMMRDEVTAITGTSVESGFDFDDGTTADMYWDAQGVRVGYLGDEVVNLWLIRTDEWEFTNGLYVGMPKADAEALYKDIDVMEPGENGGILISYDENLTPVAYNEFAPYELQVGFTKEDTVEYAFIYNNLA